MSTSYPLLLLSGHARSSVADSQARTRYVGSVHGTALFFTSTLFPSSARSVAPASSPLPPNLSPRSVISTVYQKIILARPCSFPSLLNSAINPHAHRHYVQQATSEKKRNGAVRRPRGLSTSSRFVCAHCRRIRYSVALPFARASCCHMVLFTVILLVLPGRLFDRQSLYPQNLNISVLAIPPWKTACSPGQDPHGESPWVLAAVAMPPTSSEPAPQIYCSISFLPLTMEMRTCTVCFSTSLLTRLPGIPFFHFLLTGHAHLLTPPGARWPVNSRTRGSELSAFRPWPILCKPRCDRRRLYQIWCHLFHPYRSRPNIVCSR